MITPVSRSNLIGKHALVSFISLMSYAWFMESWKNWDPEMARWKAVGDTAFLLLWVTMMIGPSVSLKPAMKPLLIWRRTISIWAALLMSLHAFLIWDGWARWTLDGLMGYEKLPDIAEPVLLQPGFGIANMIGLTALILSLILLSISSDRALNWMGAGSWKRLQGLSKLIYVLVCLHMFYFVTMHYDLSLYTLVLNKSVPDPNPHTTLFIFLISIQLIVSCWAFTKTVLKKRALRSTNNVKKR